MEFCMPLVVRQCLRERVTGTLIVTRREGAVEKSLYVENGSVVFATSRNGADLLGERLVGWGVISRSQLEEGLGRLHETGEKLGRALVGLSILTPAEVRASVQRLITERVAEVFDWTTGEVLFDENLPGRGEPAIATTPEMLLLRGVQNVTDTERVRRWLGDLEQLFVPIPEPFRFFDELSLRPEEAYIISRLDQPLTPREILSLGSFDENLVLRVVCALRFAGVLEPAPNPTRKVFWLGDGVTFDQLVTRIAARTAPPPNGSAHKVEVERPTVDTTEAARVCFLVEEKLGAIADGADHYAVLEVERRAPADRIKSSYRELAKTFHPDRHAQLAGYDANIKERLSRVFDALTRAYTLLSNAGDRAAYDAELQKRDQQSAVKSPVQTHTVPIARSSPPLPRPGTQPPPKPSAPPLKPVMPPPPKPLSPPPPKPLSPRPIPLTRPPSADSSRTSARSVPNEVRERNPRQDAPAVGDGDRGGRQSRTTDSVPSRGETKRDAPLVDLSAKFAPEPTSGDLFARGDEFASKGEHSQAARAYRKALEADPENANIHAALGRSLSQLKGYHKEAEKSLMRSIELDPTNARHLVALAKLYRSFGRRRDARELATRALESDPASVEAQDLVGSLPDREFHTADPKNPDEPGLLRRLFKRDSK
jgi:tetratricopeptide (TPR) repeat protein